MTSHTLIIPPIDLQPNPAPYGDLRLHKGVWDQLQARRAYCETQHERADANERHSVLNLTV